MDINFLEEGMFISNQTKDFSEPDSMLLKNTMEEMILGYPRMQEVENGELVFMV
jgi:hypothetical protein